MFRLQKSCHPKNINVLSYHLLHHPYPVLSTTHFPPFLSLSHLAKILRLHPSSQPAPVVPTSAAGSPPWRRRRRRPRCCSLWIHRRLPFSPPPLPAPFLAVDSFLPASAAGSLLDDDDNHDTGSAAGSLLDDHDAGSVADSLLDDDDDRNVESAVSSPKPRRWRPLPDGPREGRGGDAFFVHKSMMGWIASQQRVGLCPSVQIMELLTKISPFISYGLCFLKKTYNILKYKKF